MLCLHLRRRKLTLRFVEGCCEVAKLHIAVPVPHQGTACSKGVLAQVVERRGAVLDDLASWMGYRSAWLVSFFHHRRVYGGWCRRLRGRGILFITDTLSSVRSITTGEDGGC